MHRIAPLAIVIFSLPLPAQEKDKGPKGAVLERQGTLRRMSEGDLLIDSGPKEMELLAEDPAWASTFDAWDKERVEARLRAEGSDDRRRVLSLACDVEALVDVADDGTPILRERRYGADRGKAPLRVERGPWKAWLLKSKNRTIQVRVRIDAEGARTRSVEVLQGYRDLTARIALEGSAVTLKAAQGSWRVKGSLRFVLKPARGKTVNVRLRTGEKPAGLDGGEAEVLSLVGRLRRDVTLPDEALKFAEGSELEMVAVEEGGVRVSHSFRLYTALIPPDAIELITE